MPSDDVAEGEVRIVQDIEAAVPDAVPGTKTGRAMYKVRNIQSAIVLGA